MFVVACYKKLAVDSAAFEMNIEITESELARFGFSILGFQDLQLAEQRWIVARILRTHANAEDQWRADNIDLAHPSFSQFTILVGV